MYVLVVIKKCLLVMGLAETVAANDISSYSMDLISCMDSTCVWWVQEHSLILLQVVNNLHSLLFWFF